MARTKEGCERGKIIKEIKEKFRISDDNNSVVNSLVEELYWQIIKLRECREIIDGEGVAVDFKQGKQEMSIQNPALKTYNDLIKNQSMTIKTLLAVMGKTASKDDDLKDLMGFMNKGKKQIRKEVN